MEKWDHKPGQIDNKNLDELIRKKPGATVGDAIHGVPNLELNSRDTEVLQAEKDRITLVITKLQVELDRLVAATAKSNDDLNAEIEQTQRDLLQKKQLLVQLDTYLAKHGEINK